MTKAELIAKIAADHPALGHSGARRAVDAILRKIESALSEGRRVELRGFGNFTARPRPERPSRNPRTNETIMARATTVPLFRAGAALHQKINQAPERTSPQFREADVRA